MPTTWHCTWFIQVSNKLVISAIGYLLLWERRVMSILHRPNYAGWIIANNIGLILILIYSWSHCIPSCICCYSRSDDVKWYSLIYSTSHAVHSQTVSFSIIITCSTATTASDAECRPTHSVIATILTAILSDQWPVVSHWPMVIVTCSLSASL